MRGTNAEEVDGWFYHLEKIRGRPAWVMKFRKIKSQYVHGEDFVQLPKNWDLAKAMMMVCPQRP